MLLFGDALRFRLAVVACVFLLLLVGDTTTVLAEDKLASQVQLSKPRGVFVGSDGSILVASPGNNSIVVFENRPKLGFEEEQRVSWLAPIGVIEGIKSPPLKAPCDVAVDSRGRVAVADTDNHAVKIYYPPISDSRSRTQVIGGRLLSQFSSPEGIAIDERDNIIVFDTGNAGLKILPADEKLPAIIPLTLRAPQKKDPPPLRAPIAGCCLGKGYIAIADRGLGKYSLWRYRIDASGSGTCDLIGFGPPGEDAFNFYIRDIGYDRERGVLACIGSNFPLRDAAFLYFQAVDPDDPGKLVEGSSSPWQRVALAGWLNSPAGLAFSPGGDLYITDAASDSVQKISRENFSVLGSPVSVRSQTTRARLKYSSAGRTATVLQYGVMPAYAGRSGDPELPRAYVGPQEVFDHTVDLTDLLPSTRYAYRHLLSDDFFRRVSGEPVRNFSRTLCFATQPAGRTMEYLNFPVTVVLFTNIPGAAAAPLPEREIEKVRSQLEAARVFFWVNSRMACNMKPDIIVISEPLGAIPLRPLRKVEGEISDWSDFGSALSGLAEKYARRDLSSLGSLFLIYPAGAFGEELRNAVPMTCGLDHLGGAVSIFACAEDNTWSFVAEYQKQLSIMHLASGREVTLSGVAKNPDSDRSAVVWDSRADLLRAIGRQAWLSNRYGIFRVTRDEDEDGIPDDEPDCPLDERRFGSNPRTKDTDNDGVSDLNEILASRWARGFPIFRVHSDGTADGTRVIQNHFSPSPSAVDTDGDGVRDSNDRNPLCPLNDWIPRLPIAIDGVIKAGEWENASSMRIVDSEYNGLLRVAWSRTHLCFSLTGDASENAPSIRIRMDGAADGFLRGFDNLCLVLEPTSDGSFKVRPETDELDPGLGGSPASKPRFQLPQVVAAWSKVLDKVQIEIGLPQSPDFALDLFAREEIAFDFELHPPNSRFWLRTFEPLVLFRCILEQPPEELEMPD